jgi:ATP-dependent Clp protease adapter protein ClpS
MSQTKGDVAVAERVEVTKAKNYNIIVHNNDVTSYDEVIFIVSKVFNKSEEESFAIARKVDSEGKGLCGTYDDETANAKLYTVDMAKQYLCQEFPHRSMQIKALKFTKEEA